jgi:murein DD-endopeptidase MepM/ murein hydrolase activator NlpD
MRLLAALIGLSLLAGPAAPAPVPLEGWGWPLPPPRHVVRGFDPPAQPWLPGHRGVDIAGYAGEPVLAAGDGVVSFAGSVARVPVISVRHADGLLTTYQPVQTRLRAGDPVEMGHRIGRLVLTGSHCLPDACLHWGLRRGLDYLDPLALLRLNPVRLLPLEGPLEGIGPVDDEIRVVEGRGDQ